MHLQPPRSMPLAQFKKEWRADSFFLSPSFPYRLCDGDSESGMIFFRRGTHSRRLCRAPKMMIYFAPVLPIFGSSAKTRNPFLRSAETSRSKIAVPLISQKIGEHLRGFATSRSGL